MVELRRLTKAEISEFPVIGTIQESDVAAVVAPPTSSILSPVRPRYSDFIKSLNFKYNLRLSLFGYGIDDQAKPALHPFFDSEGSIKTKLGGRLFVRDKKYTAGATIATANVDFKPKLNSPMQLQTLNVVVGGTKATAGTLNVRKLSNGGKELDVWGSYSASANNTMRFPAPGEVQTSSGNMNDTTHLPIIWNDDILRVSLSTMVLNEIFSIRARFLIHGPDDPPTPSLTANLTEADE